MKTYSGFTLVEIMIVVAIVALLAGIAVPNMLRARIEANEANAKATLRAIATACEIYATTNNGPYPTSIDVLTEGSAPYLTEDYTASQIHGYNFACTTMTNSSYSCTATPAACGRTGAHTFTIVTGAVLSSADCS